MTPVTPTPAGRQRLLLWIAEGLGSGRAPRAPGTFGSLVGLAWFAVLLLPGNPWWFGLGALAAIPVAVVICDRAETLTGRHDPPSVVLDEVVAVPWCFVTPLIATSRAGGGFPDPAAFLQSNPVWLVPVVFGLFRLFDAWKPWPIRTVQRLPGGWGIVADDVLAALAVNVVALAFTA